MRTGVTTRHTLLVKVCRTLGTTIMWFSLLLLNLWAAAALYVDCRIAWLRAVLVVIYLVGLIFPIL